MSKTVEEIIIGLTQDLVTDWGLDDVEIKRETTLKGDLGFDSSDMLQLFTAIQEHYKGIPFKFQDLVVKDGKFVDDLTLGQIIVFILKILSTGTETKMASGT